jgi:superfamily II RNA helicase
VLFKGKVAMKAVADRIVMTEFFFSGMLNELSDPELFSIFSIFATQEKASGNVPDCGKMYSDKFSDAITFIRDCATALILMEAELEVQEEQNLEKRLNLKFYEMVYDWADQKNFREVVEDTGIDEGSMVKMFMAVNRMR